MSCLLPNQAAITSDVVLDGRLALFHKQQRWLAVADLHFGYELSQRAAGRLVPMWGMATVEDRLKALLIDYRPRHLVIVGDVVHDRAAAAEAYGLIERLSTVCEPVVIAGNHDRHLTGEFKLRSSWRSDGFHFHHGHCAVEPSEATQVIGHHHPSATVRDGAGLRLKVPVFVQQGSCWILPAFSPWASGTAWRPDTDSQLWLCTPRRILQLPETEAAAS